MEFLVVYGVFTETIESLKNDIPKDIIIAESEKQKLRLEKYINVVGDCYIQNLRRIKTLIEAYTRCLEKNGINKEVISALINSVDDVLDGDLQIVTESENITIEEKLADEYLTMFEKILV